MDPLLLTFVLSTTAWLVLTTYRGWKAGWFTQVPAPGQLEDKLLTLEAQVKAKADSTLKPWNSCSKEFNPPHSQKMIYERYTNSGRLVAFISSDTSPNGGYYYRIFTPNGSTQESSWSKDRDRLMTEANKLLLKYYRE